jgi:hypothetical protein
LKDFEGTARVRKIGDEDKTWEMEVKNDIQCGRDYSVVNSGWKPFVNEYNLQIGDVCKFKMTRFEPLSFNVNIIRARLKSRFFILCLLFVCFFSL